NTTVTGANANAVPVTLAADVASWEYSLNGGTSWNAGTGTSFNMASDTTYAAGAIQVRQTDIAGNLSAAGSNAEQWQEDSTVATRSVERRGGRGSSTTE